MSKEAEKIVLTEEQKKQIDTIISGQKQPDILFIVRTVFNNPNLKMINREARVVKEYIASKAISFSKKPDFKIQLNEEQKNLIRASWENLDNKPLFEMVFPGLTYSQDSAEWMAIHLYISDVLYPEVTGASNKSYEKKEYKSPKNLHEVCYKIREYLSNDWKVEGLKKDQKDCAEALKRYLNDIRFCTRMSNYTSEEDRKIFESTFIKYCYDKPDLTQEELDQFITLCIEVVISEDILRRMETFKRMLDNVTEDKDGKISMGLNEAIKNFQSDFNQCLTRQKNLYKTLTGERKTRIDQVIQANASVVHLVRAMKNKEKRDSMVLLAQNKQERLKEEVEKFMSMDELKGIIAGIDPDTAIYG